MSTEKEHFYFSKLCNAFEKAQKKNPAFSIRAFAQFLQIDSGSLSAIMKQKRKPTLKQAELICLKLALNLAETKKFITSTRDLDKFKKLAQIRPKKLNVYELDEGNESQAILNWEHFAILCLIETANFSSDPEWIANRLSLKKEVVERAIMRLKAQNLISVSSAGDIAKKFEGNFSFSKVSPMQKLNSAMETVDLITKSLKSATPASSEISVFSSITMPLDPDCFEEVSTLLNEFQTRLAELAVGKKPTEIYRLAVGLFPLTASES